MAANDKVKGVDAPTMAANDKVKGVDAPAMAGEPGEIVRVRGPEDGRWRADIEFGPIEVEIDLSTITAEQFAQIEADPYLTVRRVAPPPAS